MSDLQEVIDLVTESLNGLKNITRDLRERIIRIEEELGMDK